MATQSSTPISSGEQVAATRRKRVARAAAHCRWHRDRGFDALLFAGLIGQFYARIVTDIGITIVLAVSLNMVDNGMTGQFSIGHASFMTLGGYTAATITYYGSMSLWDGAGKHGGFLGGGEWLFMGSCVAGGLFAAIAGCVWTAFSAFARRLSGNVTLGFGEIIRVVLQQTGKTIDSVEEFKNAGWSQLIPPPVGGAVGVT